MRTRTFVLALAAIGLTTAAEPGIAQEPAGTYVPARSTSNGFALGAYLNGSALRIEDETSIESGGGLALRLGYGFTPRIEAFTELAVALLDTDIDTDTYGLGHMDFGLRYNFRGARDALRPYLSGAYTVRLLTLEDYHDKLEFSGNTGTIGVGLRYFTTRNFAIETGFGWTLGNFSRGRLNQGSWHDLERDAFGAMSSRFNLGISWHP